MKPTVGGSPVSEIIESVRTEAATGLPPAEAREVREELRLRLAARERRDGEEGGGVRDEVAREEHEDALERVRRERRDARSRRTPSARCPSRRASA